MEGKSTPAASKTSDVDTLSTAGDYEQNIEHVGFSNSYGLAPLHHGVDVERAEHDFAELNRKFSNISHHASRLSKQESRTSKHQMVNDLEKARTLADSDESWDLETALRGNRAAEVEAGIKNKRIGMLPSII